MYNCMREVWNFFFNLKFYIIFYKQHGNLGFFPKSSSEAQSRRKTVETFGIANFAALFFNFFTNLHRDCVFPSKSNVGKWQPLLYFR